MSSRGFTLIEMIIILGIMAIILTIAYPNFQRYYINGNLRSAARGLVGDFNNQKQRAATGDAAVGGARSHRISLDLGQNTYTLQRCTTAASPCDGWETIQVNNLMDFGNDIVFDPGEIKTTVFDFQTRGTVTLPSSTTEEKIVLRNNRGSTATVTTNISGRTFVEFSMQ
jgi:prepilin-type N-terminal cleavage/methylation domain-containing protein